jgi:hypothetical protein
MRLFSTPLFQSIRSPRRWDEREGGWPSSGAWSTCPQMLIKAPSCPSASLWDIATSLQKKPHTQTPCQIELKTEDISHVCAHTHAFNGMSYSHDFNPTDAQVHSTFNSICRHKCIACICTNSFYTCTDVHTLRTHVHVCVLCVHTRMHTGTWRAMHAWCAHAYTTTVRKTKIRRAGIEVSSSAPCHRHRHRHRHRHTDSHIHTYELSWVHTRYTNGCWCIDRFMNTQDIQIVVTCLHTDI